MRKHIVNFTYLILVNFCLIGCSGTGKTWFGVPNTYAESTTVSPSSAENVAVWQGNSATVWNNIQHKPLETVQTSTDPNAMGWVKLATINKEYSRNTSALIQQLKAWKQSYPHHPGNDLIPDESTLSSIEKIDPPKHIALLLPLDGPYAQMGQTVRNGFMSAYYESRTPQSTPQNISFYDTNQNPDIVALYQQALHDGADFIVGPLTKDKVQGLLKNGNISVPTLALNYTDTGWLHTLPTHFYEFGLSPFDEIDQIADKAHEAGTLHALIIAPQTSWGQNVTKALAARFQSTGGTVSDTLYFDAKTNFSAAIPSFLHINPKADRALMKENNNKDLLAQQRRQDFDVIFLLAEPTTARQIVPLLHYYYAGNVPIFSTSIVYSGIPNMEKDTDLNGVAFVDIPWLIRMETDKERNRLFAVGRDAYALSGALSRLSKLSNFPVYGATGSLKLTEQQQIYRSLPWTKFHDGHV